VNRRIAVSDQPQDVIAEAAPAAPWTPEVLDAVRAHYAQQRLDYLARVSAIEAFLGFAQGTDELATRVANLEAFVGIKP
jgi:hypothetical protein